MQSSTTETLRKFKSTCVGEESNEMTVNFNKKCELTAKTYSTVISNDNTIPWSDLYDGTTKPECASLFVPPLTQCTIYEQIDGQDLGVTSGASISSAGFSANGTYSGNGSKKKFITKC